MHDLALAAQAIEDEAGKNNNAAMTWLLDVTDEEARDILDYALDRSSSAYAGAVESYGASRSNPTYLLLCALRVGIQLGIAAERMRRS
jgi:hypothetical protein